MKKLLPTYRKNSYDFALIGREGDIAIYSQSDNGRIIAYEVFEVQKYSGRVIKGQKITASESSPKNEDWGRKGFTYRNLAYARKRASMMQATSANQKSPIRRILGKNQTAA